MFGVDGGSMFLRRAGTHLPI